MQTPPNTHNLISLEEVKTAKALQRINRKLNGEALSLGTYINAQQRSKNSYNDQKAKRESEELRSNSRSRIFDW